MVFTARLQRYYLQSTPCIFCIDSLPSIFYAIHAWWPHPACMLQPTLREASDDFLDAR
jgi:hypothetical protein